MQRQTVRDFSLRKSGSIHTRHYVYYGPGTVLFGHVLVVHHLDRHFQYRKELQFGFEHLDAVEGYLHAVT